MKSKRLCPVCNFNSVEKLYNQKFVLTMDINLPDTYDIVSCRNCGVVFSDSDAMQSDYDSFYSNMSKYENMDISSGSGQCKYDIDRLNQTADIISQNIPKNFSILDIGAGNGGLLTALQTKGYLNLTGVDPSLVCVKNIENKNFEGVQSVIFNLDKAISGRKFDCVILSHVMEHIYDVKSTIEKILSILNKDGFLYIEVPDAKRYKDFFISPYHYFDIEHINHFDLNSLHYLMKQFLYSSVACGQKNISVSRDTIYPAIWSIYKSELNDNNFIYTKDDVLSKSVTDYIELSSENDINKRLDNLVKSKEPVFIWGIGSYTSGLLARTNLSDCNIVGFIDSNSKKHNIKINNIKISPPNILQNKEGTVIVSSAAYGNEIVEQIHLMQINNDIIKL